MIIGAGMYTGPAGITWLHRWELTKGKKGDFMNFVNNILLKSRKRHDKFE
jgi:hypothetical protein